jgi:hypothetical protein
MYVFGVISIAWCYLPLRQLLLYRCDTIHGSTAKMCSSRLSNAI